MRAALAFLSLAAATTAAAQLAGIPTVASPAPTPGETLPTPYAHNEQGNFRTCVGIDLAMEETPAPPTCRADWDHNSAVNSADVSAYMQAWIRDAGTGTLDADFNDDGLTTSADLSAFLTTWTGEIADGC